MTESKDTEFGYMTDLLAFFESTQNIIQHLYTQKKIYGSKVVFLTALTWIKSVVHLMETKTTR